MIKIIIMINNNIFKNIKKIINKMNIENKDF
jgi:hypothetical protein